MLPFIHYSGVVVWVIYAQVEPFAGMGGNEVMSAIKADPFARHEIPVWTDAVARGVIEQCWEADGGDRPGFGEVCTVLRGWYCGGEMGGSPQEVFLED